MVWLHIASKMVSAHEVLIINDQHSYSYQPGFLIRFKVGGESLEIDAENFETTMRPEVKSRSCASIWEHLYFQFILGVSLHLLPRVKRLQGKTFSFYLHGVSSLQQLPKKAADFFQVRGEIHQFPPVIENPASLAILGDRGRRRPK